MQSFSYYAPTEIIFGRDSENQTAEKVREYGGSRILIVYGGGSVIRSGLLGKIEDILKKKGMEVLGYGGARPNPLLSHARTGVEKALEFGADFILAIGGGSAIDTAKAIAHGTANPETDLWSFWDGSPVEKSLPVGVILTISAAGSETSRSAVITDDTGRGLKRGMDSDFNRPKFAIMNPELTYTLPRYQIACGVVDIMMHTLERYFSTVTTNELTDEFAEGLLRVVMKNGKIAVNHPDNYQAMSELMWAGSVSHNGLTGLGGGGDFSAHGLGQEIGSQFDTAHGATLSIVWGALASYSYTSEPERCARLGEKVLGIHRIDPAEGAKETIDTMVEFFRSLDMPTCFTEANIPIQSEEKLRNMALRTTMYGDWPKIGNFRPLDKEDIYRIFKMVNH